jgi:uncharacterized protein YjbJ (UPF0337 family)
MNLDVLQGKWHVLRGRLRSRWGRLTNDDLDRLEGSLEQLAGLIQQRYGLAREVAEHEANAFFETCSDLAASTDEPASSGREDLR